MERQTDGKMLPNFRVVRRKKKAGPKESYSKVFLCCLLALLCLVEELSALQCYFDLSGVKRPDDDDEENKIDPERFQKFNCSAHGGKVEKVK